MSSLYFSMHDSAHNLDKPYLMYWMSISMSDKVPTSSVNINIKKDSVYKWIDWLENMSHVLETGKNHPLENYYECFLYQEVNTENGFVEWEMILEFSEDRFTLKSTNPIAVINVQLTLPNRTAINYFVERVRESIKITNKFMLESKIREEIKNRLAAAAV